MQHKSLENGEATCLKKKILPVVLTLGIAPYRLAIPHGELCRFDNGKDRSAVDAAQEAEGGSAAEGE